MGTTEDKKNVVRFSIQPQVGTPVAGPDARPISAQIGATGPAGQSRNYGQSRAGGPRVFDQPSPLQNQTPHNAALVTIGRRDKRNLGRF